MKPRQNIRERERKRVSNLDSNPDNGLYVWRNNETKRTMRTISVEIWNKWYLMQRKDNFYITKTVTLS